MVQNAVERRLCADRTVSRSAGTNRKNPQIQPDAPNLDVTLGVVYLGQREFDKAIEAAEAAKIAQPENPVIL